MSTTTNQSPELVTFFVILAVIFVVFIVTAAIVLYRRKQRGLTIKNATYGNDVNGTIEEATPANNRTAHDTDEMPTSGSVTRNHGTNRDRSGS